MSITLSAQHGVIIPDVHQDTAWVERICKQEPDADLFVFLGDYFDARPPQRKRRGVEETCRFFDAFRVRQADRSVFLLGNHDVQYLEARRSCLRRRVPRNLHYGCGSAFSAAAAGKIAKTLSAEFWRMARLFIAVNGRLLSHAGVPRQFWPARQDLSQSLVALEESCAEALEGARHPRLPHPLLAAGLVRGGDQSVGGITWQDWDYEFQDDLPCPQLVGHTVSADGARRRGRSWCLDGGQTCYAVLRGDDLQIRSA